MGKIRVFTAFSGYESQCLALERLKQDYPDFDYELVGWSEIDKYAIQAHNSLFPQWADRNFGDISKVDWSQVPDFDLLTYSFPCTNISNSGKQEGFEEGSGTRSSLLWECRKAIVQKQPKYLLLENVKALASKKFLPLFNKWIKSLEDYGYYNNWQVLNAKDYGVPQNRERVFLISIRRDLFEPNPIYHFPKPFKLELRLKDILEPIVDERYYLSNKMLETFAEVGRLNSSQDGVVSQANGIAPTHTAGHSNCPKVQLPLNPNNPSERGKSNGNYKQRIEMNKSGVANTITSVQKDSMVAEPQVLTPKRTEFGKAVRKKYENKELNISRHDMTTMEPRNDGVSNTLTSVQKDNLLAEPLCNEYNDEKTRVFGEVNEANTREVLRLLWYKVGEETIQWCIGRFVGILKEEVLRQGVYEEGFCKEGEQQSNVLTSTPLFEEDSLSNRASRDEVRDMRSNKECGCASQGFQLSKQFEREFDDIVSQLPYENAQVKECMQYLWKACKGSQPLRETLATMEEVWRSAASTLQHIQPQTRYRIRKLTPREVFRLMGVDDKDIDTIQAAGISNSQQYKLAGNSIVEDVLYHLFRKMFCETENESMQPTLF